MIRFLHRLTSPERRKNTTTLSSVEPKVFRFPRLRNKTNPIFGDVWINTKNKVALHVFDGYTWNLRKG